MPKKKDVSVALSAPIIEPPISNPIPVTNTAVENAKEISDDELESKPVKPKKEPKKRGIKKGQAC
jgi:hypothetical protein